MPRALRVFYQLLGLTFVLLGAAVWLAHLDDGHGWKLDLLRFVVGAGVAGVALATWASAIFIAYVHRRTWPIMVLAGMVVIAGGGFAYWCHQNAGLAARFI